MRCPNCGNENPPDYMFCDECGARLQPAGADAAEETGAGSMGSTPAAAPAYAGPVHSSVDEEQQYGYGAPQGGTPYQEAGAGSQQGAPVGEPGMPGGYEAASPNSADHAYDMPVTEDTAGPGVDNNWAGSTAIPDMPMPTATSEQHGHEMDGSVAAAGQEQQQQQTAMPGVVPIEEEQAPAPTPASQAVPAPVAAEAAQPSADGGQAGWASMALDHFNEAQGALARGDWAAFGRAMDTLKGVLEGSAAGAPVAMGANAMSAPATPMQAPVQATTAAPSQPATQAPQPGSQVSEPPVDSLPPFEPVLEPAAEAGTLSAEPAPVQPTYESGPMGGGASAPTAPAAGEEQPKESRLARLVVISSGAELPLPEQGEITVGREDPSSGIFPDVDLTPYGGEEGGVSRRHARLLMVGNDYYVEDLQSTNYTKLDGQRLPAHVREKLEDGARIDFGRVAVIFRRS